jgi:hypothetical protein
MTSGVMCCNSSADRKQYLSNPRYHQPQSIGWTSKDSIEVTQQGTEEEAE